MGFRLGELNMSILKSKKVKGLQEENRELKAQVRRLYEKEETVSRLDEILKNMRSEIMDAKNEKSELTLKLDNLKIQQQDYERTKQELLNELENLKHAKKEEQDALIELKDQLSEQENLIKNFDSSQGTGSESIKNEIVEAEKIRDNLILANNKLNEENSKLNNRLHLLYEQEKEIIVKLNLKKTEFQGIKQADLTQVSNDYKVMGDKIKTLREAETRITAEMKKEIQRLKDKEALLQDKITLRMRELDQAERIAVKQHSTDVKASEDKLLSLIVEDKSLTEKIDKKHKEVNACRETILKLEEKTRIIKENLEQLKATEEIKTEWIVEINNNLSEKENELNALEENLETKTRDLNETNVKYSKLSEGLNIKVREIEEIDQTLKLKSDKLEKLTTELESFEEKTVRLKAEVKNFEIRRDDAHQELHAEREEYNKLKEENKKLKELIPLLEQRKLEIKQSNDTLENRFSEMLQKLSKNINEINKKRGSLEQIILKKEKDLDEKDKQLSEKLNFLGETEKILSLRKEEIESFEDILKTIHEQNELLKNDLIRLDKKTIERRNLNGDLQLESDLLQKKKLSVENNLQEVLYSMINRLKKSTDNTVKLNNEINEYETRLTELNNSIKESMNELVEIRTTLNNTKIEHEEHRGDIAKLVNMKKKLVTEISKHQSVLEKYKKISEKIKFEQAMDQQPSTEKGTDETITEKLIVSKEKKPGDQFLKV
jgi:chromosome segregation ATPase